MRTRGRFRISPTAVVVVVLFLVACVIGAQRQRQALPEAPRARWSDGTPLGGKGFRLLLNRLGYRTMLASQRLTAIPGDARIWLLLDPQTQFSQEEAKALLQWVRAGGTLIWADSPGIYRLGSFYANDETAALNELRRALQVSNPSSLYTRLPSGQILPTLTPLDPGSAANYWSGVKQATGSAGLVDVERPFTEIAGSPAGTQIGRIAYGKGQVFVMPDALLFTNYALSKPANAVLATNFIRATVPAGSAIYFDERQHGEYLAKYVPSLISYLWRPPLRWALLQLLAAGLLMWAFYGRRLGAPVPLPEAEPVTRASQFAIAMGGLFQKADRPQAAGRVLGEEFRREVTRRLGMSPSDNDTEIATRVAQATGLPSGMIDRLLLRSKVPRETEAEVLNDAQEMEIVLQRLRNPRYD